MQQGLIRGIPGKIGEINFFDGNVDYLLRIDSWFWRRYFTTN